MSGKNIILDNEKIKKSNFYKNKKLSKILYMVKKVHLNTSLDI